MTPDKPPKEKSEAHDTTQEIARNYGIDGIGCLGQGTTGCLRGGCTGIASLLLVLLLLGVAIASVF